MVVDPFQFKGDAMYLGMYLKMLRVINDSCDFFIMSRNRGIWELFDCDIADGLSDLPEKFVAAILPVPIDTQWEEIRKLVPSILNRTDLIMFPQRNIVKKT